MRQKIQTILIGWKTAAIILGHFLATLVWSVKIIRLIPKKE